MKKFACLATAAALITVSAISLTGCGGDGHKHQWVWQHNETEHWQVCTVDGCEKEKMRGAHVDEESGTTCSCGLYAKVLGIGFTSGGDSAHADFAVEANEWFAEKATELHFTYEASTSYEKLNDNDIWDYDVIMFFNGIPSTTEQWAAFKNYIENGGGWLGFHSAAFAMWSATPATEDTSWYNYEFLRCGEYGTRPRPEEDGGGQYWNTWNPTSEQLKVETYNHYATHNLSYLSQNEETTVNTYQTTSRKPESQINSSNANSLRTAVQEALYPNEFMSSPCEWYEWEKDLFDESNIDVLISMNPSEDRPAGDDPRIGNEHQIWRAGHHPIAWSNSKYNMVYMNWGHNLQSYDHFEKSSKTFSCPEVCTMVLDSLFACASIRNISDM